MSNYIQFNFDPDTNTLYGIKGGDNALPTLVIPANIGGKSVKRIADCAFRNDSIITMIDIPDTIESIGEYAFENCSNLMYIHIGAGIKIIENEAFKGCAKLRSVDFHDDAHINVLGQHIFSECTSLEYLIIPNIDTMNSISLDESSIKYVYTKSNNMKLILDHHNLLTTQSVTLINDKEAVSSIINITHKWINNYQDSEVCITTNNVNAEINIK